MSVFIILGVLFFIIFLGPVLLKWVWRLLLRYIIIPQATKRFNKAFGGAFQGAGPFGAARGENPEQPRRKKKKIDPAVGEYIKFEEVKIEQSEQIHVGPDNTSIKFSSRIEDAEWEEIR